MSHHVSFPILLPSPSRRARCFFLLVWGWCCSSWPSPALWSSDLGYTFTSPGAHLNNLCTHDPSSEILISLAFFLFFFQRDGLSFESFSKDLDVRPWMKIRYIPSVPFWRVWGINCDSQTFDNLIHFNPLKTWGADRYHDFTDENLRLPLACELGSSSW